VNAVFQLDFWFYHRALIFLQVIKLAHQSFLPGEQFPKVGNYISN